MLLVKMIALKSRQTCSKSYIWINYSLGIYVIQSTLIIST